MTWMIERWFPCAEVSANSQSGWGSGNSEVGIMTWFAKRPTAQAKAATICSLLPWPDDPAEQQELQQLVRDAMSGRFAAVDEVKKKIVASHPSPVSTLDPFSGRGMLPLETARLGLPAHAIDYSPVAVLASRLLTDFPFRNWENEPALPFDQTLLGTRARLVGDVDAVFREVSARHQQALAEFYPEVGGRQAWGGLPRRSAHKSILPGFVMVTRGTSLTARLQRMRQGALRGRWRPSPSLPPWRRSTRLRWIHRHARPGVCGLF